jgi:hypothetical protein
MGGGGGGSRSIGDIQSLVDKAKQELREGEQAGKKNVFVSFAMEDEQTVNALRASSKNSKSPIEFNDWSVKEPINSERAEYIKRKIADRIAHCSVTVVFLSAATSKSPWVAWEIEESLKQGKHVVGVYPKDSKPKQFPPAIENHRIKCVPWSDLAETVANLN